MGSEMETEMTLTLERAALRGHVTMVRMGVERGDVEGVGVTEDVLVGVAEGVAVSVGEGVRDAVVELVVEPVGVEDEEDVIEGVGVGVGVFEPESCGAISETVKRAPEDSIVESDVKTKRNASEEVMSGSGSEEPEKFFNSTPNAPSS